IQLDPNNFKLLTEGPRNFSSLVVFTALSQRHNCFPCRDFDPEYGLVVAAWGKVYKRGQLYFAVADYSEKTGAIFQQLGLSSVPYIALYGPTDGSKPNIEVYDLNRRGLAAEELASFVEEAAKAKLKIARPVDYSRYIVYGTSILLFVVTIRAIGPQILFIFSNKQLWMIISLVITIFCCSGHMWNQIRGAPYTGARDGKPELIAPGFQNQFVIESQIVAVLYAITSVMLIGLVSRAPKIQSLDRQRFVIYLFLAGFLIVYSIIMRIFRQKNGGYPYRVVW
ncbi:hypothetical protein BJ742DRAFT_910172, partial [Cladochytrium replicatum]